MATTPIDPKAQKLAIEVSDYYRKFYPKGIIPIVLGDGSQTWSGMSYTVTQGPVKTTRLYCAGQIKDARMLYHLPDSDLEWYASNTLKENITPDRKEYHPFGPSFQLSSLERPTTENGQAWYEENYHDGYWTRKLLTLHRYHARDARWGEIKPMDLKRAWPYEKVEADPGHSWVQLSSSRFPTSVYIKESYDKAVDTLREWDPTIVNWVIAAYGTYPPSRHGAAVHPLELFSWLPRRSWPTLKTALNREGTLGLVLYLNRELNSARGPEPAVYPFGPAWTMKDENGIVEQVGTQPSNFKYREAFCWKT